MLYPIITETRSCFDLNGVWKILLEKPDTKIDVSEPLDTKENIIVPGSFNDQLLTNEARNHVGNIWYEKKITIPKNILDQRIVLRFGSVTHEATVYLNGKEIAHHIGGFLPFEVEIHEFVNNGDNRLTVRVNNILDYSTLPVGIYEEKQVNGDIVKENIPNFDFFNYAGINRPVKIYTTAHNYISDITFDYTVINNDAKIKVLVDTIGSSQEVKIKIFDEDGKLVFETTNVDEEIFIENFKPWQPLDAYLYKVKVEVSFENGNIDIYEENLGIRTVEVKDGKFYINDEPFYFKGFGKHEDTYLNGRGLNEVANLTDINIMKWMGANSFRTAHYPYSEEMMRLAEREGIVIINEVAAVGLYVGFNVSLVPRQSLDNTWQELETFDNHKNDIKDLIKRDKNYASVVMWSVANEAATHQTGADEYFKPIIDLTKELDPQNRPVTAVFIQESSPEDDKISEYLDVITLNRYYGWYISLGDLDNAKELLTDELERWEQKYPDKPIIFTEYGTDTISGYHAISDRPFTEEYQVNYYAANHEIFDEFKNVAGEQVWNFADFETADTTKRVQGNKKGIFTRAREPKMIAHELKKRWEKIPNFDYKE